MEWVFSSFFECFGIGFYFFLGGYTCTGGGIFSLEGFGGNEGGYCVRVGFRVVWI